MREEAGDSVVQYIDGWAWGINRQMVSVCLGQTAEIRQFFTTGKMPDNLPPRHRVLLIELYEIEKEQEYGVSEGDMVGDGVSRIAGNQPKAGGKATPRKGLALRSSHQKH